MLAQVVAHGIAGFVGASVAMEHPLSAKCRPYYPWCDETPKIQSQQQNNSVARSTIGLSSSQISDNQFKIQCWWNPDTNTYADAEKQMNQESERIKTKNTCTQLKVIHIKWKTTTQGQPLVIWTLECVK